MEKSSFKEKERKKRVTRDAQIREQRKVGETVSALVLHESDADSKSVMVYFDSSCVCLVTLT